MAEMWFYTSAGKQMDPVSTPDLQRLVGDGVVKPTDMVWKEGMPRWIRASSVPELFPEPTAALDRFFTQSGKSADPVPGKPAPLAGLAAVPMAETHKDSVSAKEEPQPPRKPRRSFDDDDRPSPRGRAAAAGGSSAGILIALFLGGGVLLIALVVGVVILIAVNQPGPAKQNPGIDPNNLIKGSKNYAVQLNVNERHSTVFSFRKGAKYEFVVRTQQKFVDVDLYIYDMNGRQLSSDTRPDADCLLEDWSPPEDGQFRVEVHNCPPLDGGGAPSNSTVTIREVAAPVAKKNPPKEPELPEGVLTGTGSKALAQVPPGQPHEFRMRVMANHKAKVNVSSALDMKFQIIVLKDGEDKEMARSVGEVHNPKVWIPLEATEIVRVRVVNLSGDKAAPSGCTVHYNLGK